MCNRFQRNYLDANEESAKRVLSSSRTAISAVPIPLFRSRARFEARYDSPVLFIAIRSHEIKGRRDDRNGRRERTICRIRFEFTGIQKQIARGIRLGVILVSSKDAVSLNKNIHFVRNSPQIESTLKILRILRAQLIVNRIQ